MDEWLKNLWEKNRLVFLLLLPLILLIVFKDVVISMLLSGARKEAQKAKEEDAKLEKEQDKINDEADKLKAQADALETKIKEGDPANEDWHKNYKP